MRTDNQGHQQNNYQKAQKKEAQDTNKALHEKRTEGDERMKKKSKSQLKDEAWETFCKSELSKLSLTELTEKIEEMKTCNCYEEWIFRKHDILRVIKEMEG